ncbi:hypothetical protein CCACVL1_29482 [Corchorus capsularis]|uniref:Uncharacterized protein n=1 Tax=Corchorus capsularis TaxID=210143 RepID=A0A1R3G1J4_COCAP|nr:hypothetical protein CCACVL1_29482 [Corchorus capsularis]
MEKKRTLSDVEEAAALLWDGEASVDGGIQGQQRHGAWWNKLRRLSFREAMVSVLGPFYGFLICLMHLGSERRAAHSCESEFARLLPEAGNFRRSFTIYWEAAKGVPRIIEG